MTITRICMLATVSLFATSFVAKAQPPSVEVSAQMLALAPAESGDWSSGTGAELQLRFWDISGVGVALAAGVQSWDSRTEYLETDDGTSAVATQIRGKADLIPLGASVLMGGPIGDRLAIVCDVGFRYAIVDSSVVTDIAYVDSRGSAYAQDPIEIDDTFLAVFGLDLAFAATETLCLTAGLGYQFDLMQPDQTIYGGSLGSTDFSAFTFRFGVAVGF
jgi:hypothetical protein